MPTRTDRNQVFRPDGTVLSETVVEVDTTAETNEASLRQQAAGSLAVLRTSIDTLNAVVGKANNTIGPADTKDVARECRRVARQVLALSRLMLEQFDSADTGSA